MMEEEEVSWEVDKILDHRGEEGQRFYKVKWKGRYQPLWELAEMFDTTGCIVDYWDELKRAGGGKGGGKGKGRASSSSSSSSSSGSQVGVKPMNLLQQVRFINFIKRKGIKTQNTNRALI